MRPFRELVVWERVHRLVLSIYRETAEYPSSEVYGLRSQTRRAAVSVAANIAEGSSRRTRIEYARFLDIAIASASEVEYELLLATDLEFLAADLGARLQSEIGEIRAMLISLRRRVLQTEY